MNCWHCRNGKCVCLFCEGKCGFCVSAAKYEADRAFLADFDPRKRENYRLEKPEAPAKPYLVYLPREAKHGIKPKVQRMRQTSTKTDTWKATPDVLD